MPFRWKHAVKEFRWKLNQESGLPVAAVERIGEGNYIMACPCCGTSHCLLANQPTVGLYEPLCANGQYTSLWSPYRASWIAQHPEAAKHRAIQLVTAEAIAAIPEAKETLPAPLVIAEKPRRKRQARKKAA